MSSDHDHTSSLSNEDLAPVPESGRKWGMLSFAALWVSMAACIPTYMLASNLIETGMNWSQAVMTIFLGNLIVLIPMVLNAHAGTRYGIPFPVFCRASFGTTGANVPAVLRALVACGWFGIQTWLGGEAIYLILGVFFPVIATGSPLPMLGISPMEVLCFLFFWGINMFVIWRGIDTIRFLLNIKAPLLIGMGLLLLAWAYKSAGGFGPILSQPSAFDPGQPQAGKFWSVFVPSLTGMIGFWATLSLNIPDFSRYAKSQRNQILGQALGLPGTMALYSFIGVAVTSATTIIFHETISDPIKVITHFKNPAILVASLFAVCLATLATNIAANVVSPANDFAQLAPKYINFRIGGLITGIIGILIQPWKLVADPNAYIFTLLGAFSALLGPIAGIMIADYFVYRKKVLDVNALYSTTGQYHYHRGVSWVAIGALIAGVLPSLPGFLLKVHLLPGITLPEALTNVFTYGWFLGFAIAFGLYLVLRKVTPNS